MLFGVEHARLEQRTLGDAADALGVVEPVDAEQDHLGIAEARSIWLIRWRVALPGGEFLDFVDVDRDGEDPETAAVAVVFDDTVVLSAVEELMGTRREVGDAARRLEPDQVTSEQALDDLRPPRRT